MNTSGMLVFITSWIHSAFQGFIKLQHSNAVSGEQDCRLGKKWSQKGYLLSPRTQVPEVCPPPQGTQSAHRPTNLGAGSGISTSLCLGPNEDYHLCLTGDLIRTWTLVFVLSQQVQYSGEVEGRGGSVNPQLPEQQESNSLWELDGSKQAITHKTAWQLERWLEGLILFTVWKDDCLPSSPLTSS